MKSMFDSFSSLPFHKDPAKCEKSGDTLPDDSKSGSDRKSATLSILTYMGCSVSMVLVNKCISVSLDEEVRDRMPQISVIAFQCLVAVILVEVAKAYKYVDYPSFDMKTAQSWIPLNLLFISMLCTEFLSLVYNNVPMVTVCKNLSNFFTIMGDYYFFGERVSQLTLASVSIMTMGAIYAGFNDLGFSMIGYLWMLLNCLSTSGYVLYMRFASTNIKLPKFGMVFYNNLLSMVILSPLIVIMGEIPALLDPEVMTPSFIISNIAAGFLGFYLNFASLWCVSTTSATTYAIFGSLNKVPITVLGFFLFDAALTREGVWGIIIATCGGFLYAYSKIRGAKPKAKTSNQLLTSPKSTG